MKKILIVLFIATLFFTNCSTLQELSPKTKEGAVIGAAIGGILGAILDSNKPWRGAIIGATIGSVSGGWIGYKMEQSQKERTVDAKADIVDIAAREAVKLNSVVKYERITEDGTKEEIVATPGKIENGSRSVTVEYYRNGKLILKEIKQIKIS
ncbi:MAG: YMGG-like glycine zipper-containing protein [Candidatus Omnitrophica bacterium]|nr:YMGG-like glycine zipper-containing protein [Candidatus Omnitrophota bacterium]